MEHSANKQSLVIIKVGGNIINNEEELHSFLKDFSAIKQKKILVHGGGRKATEIGRKLGIEPHYFEGRRITDKATIDLVTMVYGGLINKQVVARLQALNCNAIGLNGADANLIPADKRAVKEIDYGYVGDVREEEIAADALQLFLENKLTPVFAPLTHDGEGQILNTNADTIASSLACALSEIYKVRLIYCFEKRGVLREVEDEESVVKKIDRSIYDQMLANGSLTDGILPKLKTAFDALEKGVDKVIIGHAKDVLKNVGETVQGTVVSF